MTERGPAGRASMPPRSARSRPSPWRTPCGASGARIRRRESWLALKLLARLAWNVGKLRVLAQLQCTDIADDSAPVLRGDLSREGIHRSVTFADDGVEIRVARL